MTVRSYYEGWERIQNRLAAGIASLDRDALALGTESWPVWAIAAHLAGARVYWLCGVLGEPGVERTPFSRLDADGWEDDLAHPRSASELQEALRSTWEIVDACLKTWTEPMLAEVFERRLGEVTQH